MMQRTYFTWILLLLGGRLSLGVFLRNTTPDEADKILLLEDISLLLSSVDVNGLCHPTTNEFAPAFPKCEILFPSPTNHLNNEERISRALEQDNNQQDGGRWKNYYGYEDDAYKNEPAEVEQEREPTWFYVMHGCLTLVCVIVGAIVSGLYIGLLSLDPLLLVIKSRTARTEAERKRCKKLLGFVKQRHRLIVTLLLVNCAASEAMPIFLQNLVHESVAIILSVLLVLFFGEIFPTVIFTGQDQIQIASDLAPLVQFLMITMYPIAAPISYLLEVMSHSQSGTSLDEQQESGLLCGAPMYNRGELATLIRIQYEERASKRAKKKAMMQMSTSTLPEDWETDSEAGTPLAEQQSSKTIRRWYHQSSESIDSHDVNLVEGALQLKTKTAMDIFLSFHKVFCIPEDMILDETNIFTIYASGYSRVPVYVDNNRKKVKGILLTRQLMVLQRKHKAATPVVSSLKLYTPPCVSPETNLASLINLFQTGGNRTRMGHMALVCGRPDLGNQALEAGDAIPEEAGLVGIITLEDVLEALLQEQIYDEMDLAGRSRQGEMSAQEITGNLSTIEEGSDSYVLA